MSSSDAKPLVLLIEDHPDVAEMTLTMLEMLGCSADHAATVAEARQRLGEQRYDMILADYRLPDGNGADVLREVTSGRRVLLTAYGPTTRPAELEKVDHAVFAKPMEFQQMKELVASLSEG